MMAKLYTQDGKAKGEISLPKEIFEAEVNENLMHLVVKGYLANQRQGTAKTKGRSDVSGGGAKPFRQKGTGRARAGSNASPLWKRGGKAFGAQPRDYTRTIPKKVRRAALRSALSTRAQEEKVLVVEEIKIDGPKTKSVCALLSALETAGRKNLLIIETGDRNVYLSGRNIRNLQVKALTDVNTYDVLNNENIIFGDKSLVEKAKEVAA